MGLEQPAEMTGKDLIKRLISVVYYCQTFKVPVKTSVFTGTLNVYKSYIRKDRTEEGK